MNALPVIIVDTNNFIKAKYCIGNEKIPLEFVKEIIDALNKWAQSEGCFVDLCLHPNPIEPQKFNHFSLYLEKGKKADCIVGGNKSGIRKKIGKAIPAWLTKVNSSWEDVHLDN